MPAINAIVPWFGSKRTMADRIVAELGPHRAYWEPFCGSMAVLLIKSPSGHETVSDLHGDLTNLAWVLQCERTAAELYARLSRTLMSEELFNRSVELVARGPAPGPETWQGEPSAECVERAYHYFVMSWMGRNGVSGTKREEPTFAVRWTPGGGHGSRRLASAVGSIPEWSARLQRVVILLRDGFEVLAQIEDAEGVAIYCDPPYFAEGRLYVHNFKPDDHERLAAELARFRLARVVVSYYAHPRLTDLYPGWTVVDCATVKNLSVQGKRSAKAAPAPEVLLVNGPSLTAGEGGLFTGATEADA